MTLPLKIFRIAYKPDSFSFQTEGKAAKRDKATNKMYEPCHRNIEDRELQTHHDMTLKGHCLVLVIE